MKKAKKSKQEAKTIPPKAKALVASSLSLEMWLMIICGMVAFLLYVNTVGHDYAVDDETAIVKNKFTQEGFSGLKEIFTSPYRAGFDDRKEGLYRPLSIAMFAIEWQLSPSNPHLGHWINVILYVITALVLFKTLRLFFEKQNLLLPFIATLLFVAHPIHTEVVANIKSRDELLCFLFSLVSLQCAVKFARSDGMIYLAASGIAIFLGMLSKETAVTMVVVAPLTVYFFSNAGVKKIAVSTLPFAIAFVTYMLLRVAALRGITNFEDIQIINNSLIGASQDKSMQLATAIYILGKYLWLLIFPNPLCFDYSYNSIPLVTVGDPKAMLSFVVIAALGVLAFRGIKRKDPLSYGLLFMGATLVLVSNLFFLIEATLGERFLYIPSAGFVIAVTILLMRLFKISSDSMGYQSLSVFLSTNKSMLGLLAVILVLYSIKTISRNADWKDNLTLTSTDVKTNPNSVRIRYAYGSILVMEQGLAEKNGDRKRKFMEEGINQLTEAVKILPDYGDAWFNLGMGYKELEDYKKAITCFGNAQKFILKKDPPFYVALGVAYGEDKQYDKAFAELGKALALDSTSADAYNNMGLFYSEVGNYPLSIRLLNKSIALNPKDDNARYNLGNTYAAMGDFPTAITYYKQAVALNPNSEMAWVNLGNSYGSLKDYPNAIASFQKVLEINPSSVNARNNIGVTYFMMGDTTNANKYLPKN